MNELYRNAITSRDWTAVGIIVGILVIAGLGFVFVARAGQVETHEAIRAEEASVLDELAEAHRQRANIEQLREEMAKTQQLVSEFERRLPSQREITNLVTQFEALANDVNLRVNVTPLPIETVHPKQIIPYAIIAYGDFHQITGFINKLERHERYLKISALDIRSEEQGVSEASFTLSTYRFIQASGSTS